MVACRVVARLAREKQRRARRKSKIAWTGRLDWRSLLGSDCRKRVLAVRVARREGDVRRERKIGRDESLSLSSERAVFLVVLKHLERGLWSLC